MRLQGIHDPSSTSIPELDAYLALMKGEDGGDSFLRIMRSTERTPEKQALYRSVVRDVPYPVQVVWAEYGPALKLSTYGERAPAAAGLRRPRDDPAKHFPQEDQAPAMVDHIARLTERRPDVRWG